MEAAYQAWIDSFMLRHDHNSGALLSLQSPQEVIFKSLATQIVATAKQSIHLIQNENATLIRSEIEKTIQLSFKLSEVWIRGLLHAHMEYPAASIPSKKAGNMHGVLTGL